MSVDPLAAFGLPGPRFVHVVGAGGKSALLRALAEALASAGRSVIVTTSTRIRASEAIGRLLLAGGVRDPFADVAAALAREPCVTLAASHLAGTAKLAGLAPDVLADLAAARLADVVLVEADGAAGRPLKAHAAHEPVIAPGADLVIVVTGSAAVGQVVDDASVHRAALARERLGVGPAHRLTAADVAALVLHADGAGARIPAGTACAAFVAHDGSPDRRLAARAIAASLRSADASGRFTRSVVGDARSRAFEPG